MFLSSPDASCYLSLSCSGWSVSLNDRGHHSRELPGFSYARGISIRYIFLANYVQSTIRLSVIMYFVLREYQELTVYTTYSPLTTSFWLLGGDPYSYLCMYGRGGLCITYIIELGFWHSISFILSLPHTQLTLISIFQFSF